MIRLSLPPKPAQLALNEIRLTNDFIATGNTVWKKSYIVDALSQMSNNKCAYSEQSLGKESCYLEVEHFKPKDKYPYEVVRWGNLLPSCKKCNTTKNDWDVVADPIVNPVTDTPSDHLKVKAFRFYPKSEKGANTIEATGINDRQHFVIPRSQLAFGIADELELLSEKFDNAAPSRKNSVIQRIKSTLMSCGPDNPYSAVIATYILHEFPAYTKIKTQINAAGKWNDEFNEIERTLHLIALP